MCHFQTATENFLVWFRSVGGTFRDDLVKIEDLRARGAGRGIIAIKDIPQDTTLFTIPRAAILNVQTSELFNKLPRVFDGNLDRDDGEVQPLDSWSSLILVLLYEYLQGEASLWKPYLDILPETFDTPIFWSASELKELEGTCLSIQKIGKEESDEMLRSRVIPIVLDNPIIFLSNSVEQYSSDKLMHIAHRMGSVIMAYAFDLDEDVDVSDDEEDGWVEDKEGQLSLGMVPMADLLNADAVFNAHVNHGNDLEVTALRADIKQGSELLNYYGPLPSSELLRRYGYVAAEHHRYDVVEIPWLVVRSTICARFDLSDQIVKQMDTLKNENEIEDSFVLERNAGEPSSEGQLVCPAKLEEVSPELTECLKIILETIQRSIPHLIADKAERNEILHTIMYQILVSKLKTYPTSIELDDGLLRRQDLSRRLRMAVEVRRGEKLLLHEALSLLEEDKKRSAECVDGRARKRIKT